MAREFIEVAAVTDVGNVRQYNEDSIAVDVDNGILALADGMGGHRAGEVASRMATELLVADLAAAAAAMRPDAGPRETMLAVESSINRANKAIFAAGRADSKHGGMGTTLALALFRDGRVTWAHVGDSRVYRVRGARMRLLTRDDSLLRDQVELGVISAEEASQSHNRSLVTRALGIAETVVPHLADDAAVPDDVYVLCSDGLNDLVDGHGHRAHRRRAAGQPAAGGPAPRAGGEGQRRFRQRVGDPGAHPGTRSGGGTPRLVRAARRLVLRPRGLNRIPWRSSC